MWRGGRRPGMSVAAPFVWRCLTGAAVAPFPHPAHRTGRADLTGSAAIAGFCPHGTRRAALPQRALQEGPEAGRSSVPSLMDNRFGEREYGQKPFVRRPGNATLLASLSECLAPELDDAGLERTKRSRVEDDTIVPIVTTQHLAQPAMLLSNRGMHPPPHLLSDLLELSHHAFDLRFAFDHELAASGLPAVVRKAQEAEGLRATLPGS